MHTELVKYKIHYYVTWWYEKTTRICCSHPHRVIVLSSVAGGGWDDPMDTAGAQRSLPFDWGYTWQNKNCTRAEDRKATAGSLARVTPRPWKNTLQERPPRLIINPWNVLLTSRHNHLLTSTSTPPPPHPFFLCQPINNQMLSEFQTLHDQTTGELTPLQLETHFRG